MIQLPTSVKHPRSGVTQTDVDGSMHARSHNDMFGPRLILRCPFIKSFPLRVHTALGDQMMILILLLTLT